MRRKFGSACRRRARLPRAFSEAGFVMPSAIIVLLVITVLTGAAIAIATQSSTSTTRDDSVKAELAAAESGQHVASYRLSQLSPSESQCINEHEAVTPASTPCEDSSETLGNEATFRYWTTVSLKAGEKCAGRTVVTISGYIQRCITSEGTVDGVEPAVRLQSRVLAPPLLAVNGLFGVERVEVANNTKVLAPGGTNGTFIIGNNASVEAVKLGPSGGTQVGNGGSAGTVTKEPTPFTLTPVTPGNSATVNSNYRIENGLKSPKVAPYDESSGVTYESATRSITVGTSLVLEGEVYNFCNFATAKGAKVTVKHRPTKIYIDSPADPGSKCPAGSGKFFMANNSNIENPNKEAAALQIYVYDETSGQPVELFNNTIFYGLLYAPNSTVNAQNNNEIYGAIVGNVVNLKNNNTFHSDNSAAGLRGGPYERAVWEQCTKGSGASEGC
jgi:hypothetical protein